MMNTSMCRKTLSPLIALRSEETINYAKEQIKKSPLCPYVKRLVLFGSCARRQQNFRSDVDLLLELDPEVQNHDLRQEMLFLKSVVTPPEINKPEVDLKIMIGSEWTDNKMLFFQNVKRDGIDIWQ